MGKCSVHTAKWCSFK